MTGQPTRDAKVRRTNMVMALALFAFFGGMIGVAYAAVPLYKIFCQVTGYGGTTRRATQYADRVLDREIAVRFDSNTSAGLPWDFQPDQRQVKMKIGETTQIGYTARNLSDKITAGRASFNVTPEIAGSYFNKVECFCFTDTTLEPGQTLDMPVVFYVDPAIADAPELKNIHTITLSYTFYPIEAVKPVAAASETGEKKPAADTKIGG